MVGLKQNFLAAVFQDSSDYKEISTISLITTQGFKQTQLLIGSLQNKDNIGKLALGTLQYKQLKSRLTISILENTHQPCLPKVGNTIMDQLTQKNSSQYKDRNHNPCKMGTNTAKAKQDLYHDHTQTIFPKHHKLHNTNKPV